MMSLLSHSVISSVGALTEDRRSVFIANKLQRYQRLLSVGNSVMLLALVFLMASLIVCYTHPHYFSMTMQLAGHLIMLLAVTAIKLGYLLRCVGRHGLGVRQL